MDYTTQIRYIIKVEKPTGCFTENRKMMFHVKQKGEKHISWIEIVDNTVIQNQFSYI